MKGRNPWEQTMRDAWNEGREIENLSRDAKPPNALIQGCTCLYTTRVLIYTATPWCISSNSVWCRSCFWCISTKYQNTPYTPKYTYNIMGGSPQTPRKCRKTRFLGHFFHLSENTPQKWWCIFLLFLSRILLRGVFFVCVFTPKFYGV